MYDGDSESEVSEDSNDSIYEVRDNIKALYRLSQLCLMYIQIKFLIFSFLERLIKLFRL